MSAKKHNFQVAGGVYKWDAEDIILSEQQISHIAHNVNNPLCIVIGAAEILLDKDPDNEYLKNILISAGMIGDYVKFMNRLTETKSSMTRKKP